MKLYGFHNHGTIFFFKPEKTAYDKRDQKRQSFYDIHKRMVDEANDASVFITNDRGEIVYDFGRKVEHVPFAEWERLQGKKGNKTRRKK